MATVRILTLLGIWGLCGAGCGDAQRDARYRGVPLASFKIGLQRAGSSADGATTLQMALFYSPQGPAVTDPEQLVEHSGSTVQVPALAPTVLNVFELPRPEHMVRLPDGSLDGYALGRVLVYSDDNRDGLHTPGEPFVGIAATLAFLYLPQALPAERSPTGHFLAAGFTSLYVPQACGKIPPVAMGPGNCGVPIGAGCQVDSDCSGGLCLHATNLPWPAGYCTIADNPQTTCRPAGYVFVNRLQNSLTPVSAKNGFYLAPCQVDLDCARSAGDLTFRCDPGLLGCVPNVGDLVAKVGVAVQVEPFCAR